MWGASDVARFRLAEAGRRPCRLHADAFTRNFWVVRLDQKGWLGRQDSNLRMAVPKTAALPLGYTPNGPEDSQKPIFLQQLPALFA